MMKLRTKYMLMAFVAAALGGNVALAKVSVVQQSSAALARGSSFAWAPIAGRGMGSSDAALNNEIIAGRLRSAIETSLIARGYRKVESPAQANLVVSYRVVLQDKKNLSVQGWGGRCAPRFGCLAPTSYDVTERNYTQGTLVLDLRERGSGRLVWRAATDKKVKSEDASQEKLNKELMAMTKSLPPA